jgi:hypothetical protein
MLIACGLLTLKFCASPAQGWRKIDALRAQ